MILKSHTQTINLTLIFIRKILFVIIKHLRKFDEIISEHSRAKNFLKNYFKMTNVCFSFYKIMSLLQTKTVFSSLLNCICVHLVHFSLNSIPDISNAKGIILLHI